MKGRKGKAWPGKNSQGVETVVAILALVVILVALVVFLIAIAYFVAIIAILAGVALVYFAKGNVPLAVIGGVIAVAGVVDAIFVGLGVGLVL